MKVKILVNFLLLVIQNILCNQNSNSEENNYLINSRCNMLYSKLSLFILSEIANYYSNYIDLSKPKCMLRLTKIKRNSVKINKLNKINGDANQSNIYKLLFINDVITDRSPGTYKCFKCKKKFKKKEFLVKHLELFHYNTMYDTCLADYCNILNCDRYIEYFSNKEYVFLEAKEFNNYYLNDRIPSKMYKFDNNKTYSSLIHMNNKLVCFSLINNCLKDEIGYSIKESLSKDFYHRFCRNLDLDLELDGSIKENNESSENKTGFIEIESTLKVAFKQIFKFTLIFFIVIYLLVLWISRK